MDSTALTTSGGGRATRGEKSNRCVLHHGNDDGKFFKKICWCSNESFKSWKGLQFHTKRMQTKRHADAQKLVVCFLKHSNLFCEFTFRILANTSQKFFSASHNLQQIIENSHKAGFFGEHDTRILLKALKEKDATRASHKEVSFTLSPSTPAHSRCSSRLGRSPFDSQYWNIHRNDANYYAWNQALNN